MHRHHHGPKIIRVKHGRPRFLFLDPFVTPKQLEPMPEIVQIFAFRGIDDANALQRDVQPLCRRLDGRSVAEENRCTQSQRIKLARRLQDARLGPFRKNDPFRMPLKLLDQTANKSHAQTTTFGKAKMKVYCTRNFPNGARVSSPAASYEL